ncbi:MAG: hypothetical protein IPL46_00640 [Saprospiraceae bacterium]|nr:hypothetical protein [Saprospiraceae bacterium]
MKVSSAAAALHVTLTFPARMGIISGAVLLIKDSPGNAMYLTGEMLIQNGGAVTINNALQDAILAYHSMTNNGTISITKCSNGIEFLGSSDTLFNHGEIDISDVTFSALLMSSGANLVNTRVITLNTCFDGLVLVTSSTAYFSGTSQVTIENSSDEGISARHNVEVLNEGVITIDNFGAHGLRSYGSFVNDGQIDITRDVSGGTGIKIDSFSCCSGSVYLGSITNTGAGIIQIDHAETGLLCEPSTTLLNEGSIDITDCSGTGFHMEPRSDAALADGSVMMLSEMYDPVIIDKEATLDVQVGAELIADL